VETNATQREIRDGTLTIRVTNDGSRCTVALVGELDLANTATLSAALDRAASDGEPSLTIDLSELAFIDSTGIALLVATHRQLEGSNRLSLIPSRTSAVRRVMALTGLDAELPFAAAGDANDRG
jgi:anti-sigma B factor antagonist